MAATLTDRCDQCGTAIYYRDDEGDWVHKYKNNVSARRCTFAWPRNIPTPSPDEYYERRDFELMLRGRSGRVTPRKTTTVDSTKAEREIERLQRRIDMLKQFPFDDPFLDGDVIWFEKQFPGISNIYKYVAIRQKEKYYLTGTRHKGALAWPQLVELLVDGNTVGKIWFVNSWTEMVKGETV